MDTYNQWTSKSDVVRDSKSPQDLVTVFRKTSTPTGTIDVPFAEGTKVLIFPVMEGVTVVNPTTGVHEVVYNFIEPGGVISFPFTSPIAGVMVQAKAQQEQTPFTSI